MNFFKPRQSPPLETAPPPSPQNHPLHQALTLLQTQFSNFFYNFQPNPPGLNSSFAKISNQNNAVDIKPPKISNQNNSQDIKHSSSSNFSKKSYAMSVEAIEERLAGVPVYALSNSSQEFVLVSGANSGKNLGLFCFSEADANAILKQMKSVDPSVGSGSQIVPLALSKIVQLKVDGVALRLIPEVSEIRNALKERKRAGVEDESFSGVPVFQSKSLILRSQNKRYRPVFFRKEDLEKSLSRASSDQKQLNPSLRGDIQVAVLEDIIHGMKDSSTTSWDDVVFVPPGFDVSTVSTDPSQQF